MRGSLARSAGLDATRLRGGARLPACEIVKAGECLAGAGTGHQPVFSSGPGLVICRHSGLRNAAYVRN